MLSSESMASKIEENGTIRYTGSATCNTCGMRFSLSPSAARELYEDQKGHRTESKRHPTDD